MTTKRFEQPTQVPSRHSLALVKLEYWHNETYAGKPALATAEMGGEFFEILSGHVADAWEELWEGKIQPEEFRSPLWPIRWIFTSERLTWLLETATRRRNRIF